MVLSETVNLVPKNNIFEIRGDNVFSILVTIRVFVEKKKSRFLIDIHKQYQFFDGLEHFPDFIEETNRVNKN